MRRVLPLILLVFWPFLWLPNCGARTGQFPEDRRNGARFPDRAALGSARRPGNEPCTADEREECFDHVFPCGVFSGLHNGVHAGRQSTTTSSPHWASSSWVSREI